MPCLTTNFANANSTHRFGIDAHNAVKIARKQVADLIGAEPYEIVFTSGAFLLKKGKKIFHILNICRHYENLNI